MPNLPCPHCAESHPASAGFCPATGKRLVWDASVGGAPPAKGVADLLQEAFALYRAHARALLITCALLIVPASLAKSLALALIAAPVSTAVVAVQPDVRRLERTQRALTEALARGADIETLARLQNEHKQAAATVRDEGLAAAAQASGEIGSFFLRLLATFVTVFFLYGLIVPLTNGALTIAVADRALGGQAAPREVWMLLLSRLGSLLPTVLLAALAVTVGFLLFVVPGVVLGFLFAFVSPVVLIERRAGTAALKRSIELVRSDWLRVALVLIVFGVIQWFAKLVASLLIPHGLTFLSSFFGDLVLLALMPVPVLGLVLIYLDIRRRKEGLAESELQAELASLRGVV